MREGLSVRVRERSYAMIRIRELVIAHNDGNSLECGRKTSRGRFKCGRLIAWEIRICSNVREIDGAGEKQIEQKFFFDSMLIGSIVLCRCDVRSTEGGFCAGRREKDRRRRRRSPSVGRKLRWWVKELAENMKMKGGR